MGEGLRMGNYCKYCNKTLSEFEVQHIALHHPDKQLCRPCFVYRQPDPVDIKALTEKQRAENGESLVERICRQLKSAAEQGE